MPENLTLALLNAYRPDLLDELRRKHPEAAASLDVRGLVLGTAEDAALRDAAVALLDNSSAIADEAAAAALRKLRSARRLELAGSIIAAASSAGVISALSGIMEVAGALPLAVISLLAAAIPLISGWLRNTDGGASVAEALAGLREAAWDAQALRGRIARGDAPASIVDDVNAIARSLGGRLAVLGYPAAVRPL